MAADDMKRVKAKSQGSIVMTYILVKITETAVPMIFSINPESCSEYVKISFRIMGSIFSVFSLFL